MSTPLPVADGRTVRRTAVRLIRSHASALAVVLGLHVAAALCGLIGPAIVGRIIDAITAGRMTSSGIDVYAAVLVGALVVQAGATRVAQFAAVSLGENVFAQLREDLLRTVAGLPLSTVERAGTGDLLGRTTNDIENVASIVRFGVPRILVAGMTAVLTIVATVVTNAPLSLALLAGIPVLVPATRWYLHRAGPGYRRRLASYALVSGTVSETVDGAETVDALSLGAIRRGVIDEALRERRDAERYTLWLRTRWFPATTVSFLLPVIAAVAWGAYLVSVGHASVGEVTAVALYAMQLTGPIDELIGWIDQIQVGTTALARIVGVSLVPPVRAGHAASPESESLRARDVRFAYRPGADVLHDVSLDVIDGERLAIVGPSGSGKSTLGRLLAGIDRPDSGSVTLGGATLFDIPPAELRRHVALVTQESYVFVGSVADNLRLVAPDAETAALEHAMRTVGGLGWVAALPQGFDTAVGSGGVVLTPAQTQQLALARVVLLDPHTVILDEATSLLDAAAARSLEGSLSAVLAGRTVIAIAHRLYTARDADRVVLMDGGHIVEQGSHDMLLAHGGQYARLWASWHGGDGSHAGR